MKNPTVDVVIPVYNGEAYVLNALRSVEMQTCRPKAIILVDDGSTDSTGAKVAGYKGAVPVDYVRQENRGLSAARNAGIRRCTGDYVAFLDVDDEWLPEKLERQVKLMASSTVPNLGVVYCNCCIVDETGQVDPHAYLVAPHLRGSIFDRLLNCNTITGSGSSVLVRRSCFDEGTRFDETMKAFEDWDMWLRLSLAVEFDFVPESLVRIRRHGGNMQKDTLFMFENSLLFYDKWSVRIAPRRDVCLNWRNSIVHKIIEHLPDLRFLRSACRLLSPSAKRALFRETLGSLELFLLLKAKPIAGRMLRFAAGRVAP